MKKNSFLTHNQVWEKHRNDPVFQAAYKAAEPGFLLIDKLVEARKAQKISQREFAKRVGMAQSALARFEAKKTNPTLSSLTKIITALGLRLKVGV